MVPLLDHSELEDHTGLMTAMVKGDWPVPSRPAQLRRLDPGAGLLAWGRRRPGAAGTVAMETLPSSGAAELSAGRNLEGFHRREKQKAGRYRYRM